MLKQPVGIVKFTNVALIKYKKDGKKFEIACYKNTATDWRNGM
jgi:ribosome maturation protein SDO1